MDWLSPFKEISTGVLSFLDNIPFLRAVIAVLLVFFLPGFAWTRVFFKQLRLIEQIPVSIALSISIVTLGMLFISVLGAAINGFNAVLLIIIATIIPVAVFFIRRYLRKPENVEDENPASSED